MDFDLSGCRDISIYLGNKCNFNCVYCDRDYIAKIGDLVFRKEDIEPLMRFLSSIGALKTPPTFFSFHGGEPLVYVKIMDEIITRIVESTDQPVMIFVQTNGSLITKNRWFFEKWRDILYVSISYDFMHQTINRTPMDAESAIAMLNDVGITKIQLQYVMPISDPKVFGLNTVKSITRMFSTYQIQGLVLIPLRHYRGADKFKVIIDELDLPQFFGAFMRFIHVLYAYNINVQIDGQGEGIDKHYFDNHKQLVISPDGKLYPEYDFLEYQWHHTAIGEWKNDIRIDRHQPETETSLILDDCRECPSRPVCGLKYLFKGFDKPRMTDKCKTFYQMMNAIILHTQKLKQQPSFFHWIGV